MRALLILTLAVAAHLNLTPFSPAPPGKGWLLWPFAVDSRPVLPFIGGLPRERRSAVTALLSGVSGMGFLAAVFCLFGVLIPLEWWYPLILISAGTSLLLFLLYRSRWSVLPIAIDLLLLWGVILQGWTAAGLRNL